MAFPQLGLFTEVPGNRDCHIWAKLLTVRHVLLGRGIWHSSSHPRLVVHGCTILKIIGNQTAIIESLHAAGIENN